MAGTRHEVGSVVRHRQDGRTGVVVDVDRELGPAVWWLPNGPRSVPEDGKVTVVLSARGLEQVAALQWDEAQP
jgi:hypothetical protein